MNESQFKSRVLPLHKTLFAYALVILGDEGDAADCLQDAMTKLWENRFRLEQIDNLQAYAAVTVKHIALSMTERGRRRPVAFGDDPPDFPDPAPSPAVVTERRDDLHTVSALISELPENQRRVVLMSAVSGLSNAEIASSTGLSDDNVRVLLSRGRKRLRQLFSLKSKET